MVYKLDFKKTLKRREETLRRIASQSNFGKPTIYFKPKQGKNHIRILPPFTNVGPNANVIEVEKRVHFGVTAMDAPDEENKFVVQCPALTKGAAHFLGLTPGVPIECPVCNYREELNKDSDPVQLELAKQIRPGFNYYSNVLDMRDPVWTEEALEELLGKGISEENLPEVGKPKIQVYRYGQTVSIQITDYINDNIDPSNIKTGHDIFIERMGTGLKTKYTARLAMKPTALPYDIADIEEGLYDLDNILPWFNTEQINAILSGATYQEVYQLKSASVEEEKQLEEPKTRPARRAKMVEAEPEPEIEDESNEAIQASSEEENEASFPPLDENGEIDFEQLTDEQIEDKTNAQYVVNEQTPFVECFGKARQRDPEDDACLPENCGLSERCEARIAELDEIAAKEAAKKRQKLVDSKKKKVGKKVGKKATTAPAKVEQAAGKNGNGNGNLKRTRGRPPKKEAAIPAASLSIEEEMMAELEKSKRQRN